MPHSNVGNTTGEVEKRERVVHFSFCFRLGGLGLQEQCPRPSAGAGRRRPHSPWHLRLHVVGVLERESHSGAGRRPSMETCMLISILNFLLIDFLNSP